ncbi:11729_t:CDS:2 [Ambispora leptoticha]|uniref:11729_t:CDS:1 n=1 Tax=Ambispora leptoticha TaxID=144679 RepID=A0A9N9CB99_9GLOM|nr:11729_t:CDS:2 [Ambispora leptoticha]
MKPFIISFLIVGFAIVIYAEVCTIGIKYSNGYMSQTGDNNGGCFGIDNSQSISQIIADPSVCYRLFQVFGCSRKEYCHACGTTTFPHNVVVSSILIMCNSSSVPGNCTQVQPLM